MKGIFLLIIGVFLAVMIVGIFIDDIASVSDSATDNANLTNTSLSGGAAAIAILDFWPLLFALVPLIGLSRVLR